MRLVALKIAIRELRGGLKGFWIYLACLALGTTAIASAGSVSEVFTRGLANEARTLLGADILFSTSQRRVSLREREFIASQGRLTETATIDAMGSIGHVREQVNVRAVDQNFPLMGEVTFSGGKALDFQSSITKIDGVWGAVVSKSFLDALKVSVGDEVRIGPIDAVITAQLDGLPDRIGTPGTFVPDAVVSLDALIEANRLTNGQIFSAGYLVVFEEDASADKTQKYENTVEVFNQQFPNSVVRIRGPEDAVDGLRNLLELLNSFLSVIGIAALVAGGVGIAQATTTFLQTRMHSIATLKALGADTSTIRRIYILQLGFLAVLGSMVGIAFGAMAPFILNLLAAGKIPLPQAMGIYPLPLLKAFILGMLTAVFFALPAIGRACATPPAALFRTFSDAQHKTPWGERLWALAAGIALVSISVVMSEFKMMTLLLLSGAIVSWGLFHVVAWLIKTMAAKMAHKAKGFWRLALSNMGGVGSLAPTIVPALGLGLALLTLVASVQSNLLRQISETAPANAPSMILSQIPSDHVQEFDGIMQQGGIDITDPKVFRRVPFLLARMTEIKDKPIVVDDVPNSERWVVSQEINLTYMAKQPPEVTLLDGKWWAEDYRGDLLVSVERDVAEALELKIGDNLGFRVFGRDIKAQIASTRIVEWGTFGIASNAAFIFSPGALEAAKSYHVAIAKSEPDQELNIISNLGDTLSGVVVLRTRPLLKAASKIFADISVAVNAAAGVVSLAGLLVLFGAFAALSQKRQPEAALLKAFGAKSDDILRLYSLEFMIAGGIGAFIGTLIGVGAAYPIVVIIFEAQWSFPWRAVLTIMGTAIIVSAIGGISVGMSTLAHPVMRVLRSV